MRIPLLILMLSAFCLTVMPRMVSAQTVSEEARRHMDRGQAAIEMATTPEDLNDAVKEFQKAIDLVPNWPDPYYNLGMAQDKIERYDDAIRNFTSYLELAPQANDAAQVKQLINKIEYKKEKADRSQSVIKTLTGPGELRWTSGKRYNISDPHSKFRLRDGKLEGLVFHSPFSPYQWIPVAFDGKQLLYEFTWYTISSYPFKASVTLEIISTSPLRLKAKLVDVQQWGDHSAEEYDYVLEWANDR